MISAQNLTKKFGSILALDTVSFKLDLGEFVFLTGASGSGKSTLLKLLLREFKPDKGILTVDGQDLAKLPTSRLPLYRRQVGIVFQDFKMLSDRNVFENVSLPLEIRGIKNKDELKAVTEALTVVGLVDRADLFPAQLSGGEIQRVAIARAIVAKPKLLLADEPTGNLDPKTSVGIVKLLRSIHQELKTTVIMATHNADIVNHASLRVISLASGKIVKDSQKGKYE